MQKETERRKLGPHNLRAALDQKDPGHTIFVSVATPAEPRGEKVTCFFLVRKVWAVKNFYNLLRSASEIFLSGLRGAKNCSVAFRIVFRIFFRGFKTAFRIDLKAFCGGEFRSADMPP